MAALEFYGYISPKLAERFWLAVDDNGDEEACWTWTKAHNQTGYGIFSFGLPSKFIAAHKASFILSEPGVIVEEGMVCHHTCDGGPGCVNFRHIRLMDNHSTHMTNNPDHHPSRGESHHRALITEMQVVEIRALHGAGVSQTEIAKRYGIAPPTVHQIVHRTTWQHVEEA